MKELSANDLVILAQSDNYPAREDFIQSHKPFIARVSSKICHRYLSWENDDELSIALLAFNEAIDSFNPNAEVSFHSFVQLVIRRRLVDYFRKEGKHLHLSLAPMNPEDTELSYFDAKASEAVFQEQEQCANLQEIIEHFIEVLSVYEVTLDELVKVSPKHKTTKAAMQKAAILLSCDSELMEHLKKHKFLPIKKIESTTGIKRKTLENGRKYIIALALILVEPKFYSLKTFLQI